MLLSALFYAGGGTPSGIGNLLIVSVAIANILLRGRFGVLIAAAAAIGMIYLTFYLSLKHPQASAQYVQVGALGALCFAAALFVQGVTRRLQASESLAEQRAADVADLETLNNLILQRMRTGILVVDEQRRVLLANQAALGLLDQQNLAGKILDPHCTELVKRLQHWQENSSLRPASLQTLSDGPTLQPSFIALQRDEAGLQGRTVAERLQAGRAQAAVFLPVLQPFDQLGAVRVENLARQVLLVQQAECGLVGQQYAALLVHHQNAGTHALQDQVVQGFQVRHIGGALFGEAFTGLQAAGYPLHEQRCCEAQRPQRADLHVLGAGLGVFEAQVEGQVDHADRRGGGDQYAEAPAQQDVGDRHGDDQQVANAAWCAAPGIEQR